MLYVGLAVSDCGGFGNPTSEKSPVPGSIVATSVREPLSPDCGTMSAEYVPVLASTGVSTNPPLEPTKASETSTVPSGLKIVIAVLLIKVLVTSRICWPWVPSKTTIAISPGVFNVTVLLTPAVSRAVAATLDAGKGAGT